ncbi:hypothetical protein D3C80_1455190 [compost metagenome]
MTTDIKALLQRYEQVNAELSAALTENGKEFIQSLFADIFQRHPGVNRMCVMGWTPYFNDGDACTHSSEFFTGVTGQYSGRTYFDFDDYSEACEFMTNGLNEDDNEENELGLTPNTTDNKVLKSAKSALAAYDEIFTRQFETNFVIKATRNEDGTVTVEDEYYNPEY